MAQKEQKKRRWGDRKDGVLLRKLDGMHFIMPIIYPNRRDNEAYISETIDLTNVHAYLKQKNGLEAGNAELKIKADEKQAAIDGLNSQAAAKEATLTSVRPTVTAINTILTGFGFDGFKLAENTKKKGTYAIIRPDGSDASTTLSEGEHNFLTFLYFYHLCFGSQNCFRKVYFI